MSFIERRLETWLASDRNRIGEIAIAAQPDGSFVLCHRDDAGRNDLRLFRDADDAREIAKYDDEGRYRPLKTAPSLRHGWHLSLLSTRDVRVALDFFYPARLAWFDAFESNAFPTTSFRETLDRQTGMYRVAARITEEQADALIGSFCRSDGGCLRTIMWKRDPAGTDASSRLPRAKFEPEHDQAGGNEKVIPLLCQEACNLLVSEARKVVKPESGNS